MTQDRRDLSEDAHLVGAAAAGIAVASSSRHAPRRGAPRPARKKKNAARPAPSRRSSATRLTARAEHDAASGRVAAAHDLHENAPDHDRRRVSRRGDTERPPAHHRNAGAGASAAEYFVAAARRLSGLRDQSEKIV